MRHRTALVAGLGFACALATATTLVAQDKKNEREAKVRGDKEHVTTGGAWIYDDLPRGIDEAKKSGKPLLVVFRCIPCEACAKIDEDVVDRDPIVAKLLDRYVCVRIPHMNGVDLSVFQFDYDQSWAAFMLNADLTIYGRYGTRSSQKESKDDVSLEGFAKALEGGLALHAGFPANAESLKRKQLWIGRLDPRTPERLPSLKDRFKPSLDWEGKVVPSCIHCHMVAEGLRRESRDAGKAIPLELLHRYPSPATFGLVMDPRQAARVASVTPGSSAERSGFKPGDDLVTAFGQPLVSIADLQWELGWWTGIAGKLNVEVLREGATVPLTLRFAGDWWRRDDISWRASSWDLRRMVTGGLVLVDLTDDEREKAGIDKTSLALRVKHVGQYGDHAAGKKAGFLENDVFVSLDGRLVRMSESELLTSLATSTIPGEKVPVTVLRDGKKLEMALPMQ